MAARGLAGRALYPGPETPQGKMPTWPGSLCWTGEEAQQPGCRNIPESVLQVREYFLCVIALGPHNYGKLGLWVRGQEKQCQEDSILWLSQLSPQVLLY